MNLRALIFDVDGTLAETEEAHRAAFNQTFVDADLDWHWTVDDYTRLLETTGGKERMRQHRKNLGFIHPSDDEIAGLHKLKTKAYVRILEDGGLELRPGVSELIERARSAGLKIAVATTTNLPNVDALCQSCWGQDGADVFDVICAGDEVAAKKPAPDVFLLALKRLNIASADAIAFEDSINGLRSARAAGLTTIVTPSIYTAHQNFISANRVLPDLLPSRLPPELWF
jgi:HAD superfamily hydrolase (TIGR01509 family)